MSAPTTRLSLKPKPGFCVKSATVQDAFYKPALSTPSSSSSTLEVPDGPGTAFPKGLKCFINIAWDSNVPPPPEGSEEAIHNAMQGQEIDELNPDGWYVPVVVSDGRLDKDKAGKPSLVFDCVFHSSIKTRVLRDPEFKLFIIELSLQRIEAQTPFVLSRQLSTPNISAKGRLLPRTVSVPTFVLQNARPPSAPPAPSQETGPLIEELPQLPQSQPQPKKSILKTPPSLTWSWSKDPSSSRIRIRIPVPNLTREMIALSTFDIEPRRFLLSVPTYPTLDVKVDVDVNVSSEDAASGDSTDGAKERELRRERAFDVDVATVEWHVRTGVLEVAC